MFRTPITAICLLLAAAHSIAGEPTAPESSDKNPLESQALGTVPAGARDHFRVSAGWMWREVGDIRFVTRSRSGSLSLPSLFGSSQLQDPAVGGTGSYGFRRYADGYVGVDEGTVNDGATSLWGYDHADQAGDGEIRFHSTGSRSSVRRGEDQQPGAEWHGDDGGSAPVIQLDWWREIRSGVSAGAQLQWSFLQLDSQHRSSDFSAWQERDSFSRSLTDSYNLQGITPPEAPYAGAGLGFGPLLNNIPDDRGIHETPAGSARAAYFNDIRQSLDIKVNTLSLGPTLSFAPANSAFQLQCSGGLSLNITDWDADQQETLFLSKNGGAARALREWHSHAGGTDVLPGFYLQGGATLQVTRRLSLTGFGRYEWSDTLDARVGASTLHLDLSGWSAGLMLGCRL